MMEFEKIDERIKELKIELKRLIKIRKSKEVIEFLKLARKDEKQAKKQESQQIDGDL